MLKLLFFTEALVHLVNKESPYFAQIISQKPFRICLIGIFPISMAHKTQRTVLYVSNLPIYFDTLITKLINGADLGCIHLIVSNSCRNPSAFFTTLTGLCGCGQFFTVIQGNIQHCYKRTA